MYLLMSYPALRIIAVAKITPKSSANDQFCAASACLSGIQEEGLRGLKSLASTSLNISDILAEINHKENDYIRYGIVVEISRL